MQIFKNKRLLILVSIFLITCFLISGCWEKTSSSGNLSGTSSKKAVDVVSKNIDSESTRKLPEPETAKRVTESKVYKDDSDEKELRYSKQDKPKPSKIISESNDKTNVDKSKSENVSKKPSVTISITGSEDVGMILKTTEVEVEKDDTVLDILKRVTRENKIPMSFRGRKSNAYVEGIDNIFEFDLGPQSGWMYRINGTFPNKSAGAVHVEDGDVIEWLYTVELGKEFGVDVGNL